MTADWISADLSIRIEAPFRNGPFSRHPHELQRVIEQFEVLTAERYRKRDVNGDGFDDTFCNFFVADVTRALGCPVPQMRANDQHHYLDRFGAKAGWWRVGEDLARTLSGLGAPVVAAWRNPDYSASGHVAILVPPLGAGLWIAQAGRKNFNCGPLGQGFGDITPDLWAHA